MAGAFEPWGGSFPPFGEVARVPVTPGHVLPEGDDPELHRPAEDCGCNPTLTHDGNQELWVHRSLRMPGEQLFVRLPMPVRPGDVVTLENGQQATVVTAKPAEDLRDAKCVVRIRSVDTLVRVAGGEVMQAVRAAVDALTDRELDDGAARARAGVLLQDLLNDCDRERAPTYPVGELHYFGYKGRLSAELTLTDERGREQTFALPLAVEHRDGAIRFTPDLETLNDELDAAIAAGTFGWRT